MKTWEYTHLIFNEAAVKGMADKMNDLGKSGWELASTTDQGGYIVHYFKRPVEDRWYAEREGITLVKTEPALADGNGEGEEHDIIADALSQQAAAQAR